MEYKRKDILIIYATTFLSLWHRGDGACKAAPKLSHLGGVGERVVITDGGEGPK